MAKSTSPTTKEVLRPNIAYHRASCFGPSDQTRKACLKDPFWAYKYASDIDRHARNDTRKAASLDSLWALPYAIHVDGAFHKDTFEACLTTPYQALQYCLYVSKRKMRAKVKQACLVDPWIALCYGIEVEQKPDDATRKAVLCSPIHSLSYAIWVDRCYRPDTFNVCRGYPRHLYHYGMNVAGTPPKLVWDYLQETKSIYFRKLFAKKIKLLTVV